MGCSQGPRYRRDPYVERNLRADTKHHTDGNPCNESDKEANECGAQWNAWTAKPQPDQASVGNTYGWDVVRKIAAYR